MPCPVAKLPATNLNIQHCKHNELACVRAPFGQSAAHPLRCNGESTVSKREGEQGRGGRTWHDLQGMVLSHRIWEGTIVSSWVLRAALGEDACSAAYL